MCTTCGCAAGEQRIEGDDHHHDHEHHHTHPHGDHHHDHEHHHEHAHGHHHDHEHHGHEHHGHHHHAQDEHPQTIVVHHHYHHTGDVHHHHYNYVLASDAELHLHDHQHKHKNKNKNKGKHQHIHEEKFVPEQQDNDLHYGKGEAGSHAPGMTQRRMLQIEQDVLGKNNHLAEHNREHFTQQHIAALNLVSSPGSGKTTLLTETLKRIADRYRCAVIEGDQQTTNDAERIRATGVPAI
ncbi:MAG: GTP-binding protein, partial [Hafnia sp.]